MTTRMLIDARHREETRVAVIKGHRIEEFDFESAEHKQLKGNIYLAKVTRVEPSLQAAFVEYGGNRHGFLAFSEIHPDYYQIPKEDRDALLREEAEVAAAMRAEEDLEALEGDIEDVRPPEPLGDDDHADEDEHDDGDPRDEADGDGDADADNGAEGDAGERRGRGRRRRRGSRDRDERDEAADRRHALRRRYKIQDVIKRRQVMLVQVVKEERGNKGAALTSYLSLAGRYCVLMPNSSHGGGISRKISNGSDRRRLKTIIDDLGLPASMGCIVRTAGLERTKTEIKRDFDYLARLWDEIRDKTLKSAAPALIHSDSDLIKRAIRDIYNNGIEEVLVEGDDGYRAAKDFMKLLMPSHARRVKQYADPVPLYQRYGVEDQLGAMYQPLVPLKSGGYLVINPTEALVSIDINSGRSTREHNIEQTAVSTNLEAAYEIARQLRLRDMAGLVVIDFIDMDLGSNVRKVERAMKDALKNDRARIQVGRISGFGLMEMSRQRLRTGVLEASTRACPHCEGTGLVRTASSAGLSALRLLEEEAARGRGSRLTLRASQEASFYVLNNKRAELSEIEARYGVTIEVQSDGQTEGARMTVDVSGPPPANLPRFAPIVDLDEDEDDAGFADLDGDDEEEEGERTARGEDGEQRKRKRRNRRRKPRRGDEDRGEARGDDGTADGDTDANGEGGEPDAAPDATADADDNGEPRKRRRGRRGGRGRRGNDAATPLGEAGDAGGATDTPVAPIADAGEGAEADVAADAPAGADLATPTPAKGKATRTRARKAKAVDADAEAAEAAPVAAAAEPAPAKPRRSRKKADATEAKDIAAADTAPAADVEAEAEAPKAKRTPRKRAAKADADVAADQAPPAPTSEPAMAEANGGGSEDGYSGEPRRRGWWQRTFGA